jgi:hypothetical protein
MGSTTGRTFGAIREAIPGSLGAPNVAQGIRVEVGDKQAAIARHCPAGCFRIGGTPSYHWLPGLFAEASGAYG